jgi:hypothetical protein
MQNAEPILLALSSRGKGKAPTAFRNRVHV